MSHALVHRPVGGPFLTRTTRWLLLFAVLGGAAMLWRLLFGLGSVSNLNDGYPWGIWIALDVVVGTALGCGGYAVALLVYILNRGRYHPLVRPAMLTSLLGYGLAVLAVTIDLGRFWELWKVPVFVWRWTGSPQLEVALCVAAYVLVLLVEMSPALFEKWRDEPANPRREMAKKALGTLDRGMPWILALGLLLPTMHQSSLGTMMLLPGPRMHPLWFTPWLPFLFLVNCVVMGYAIVAIESAFSSWAFGRPRETAMLERLGKVALGVTAFWTLFRVVEVALAGELAFIGRGNRSWLFVAEVVVHLVAIALLASPRWRARADLQLRAAILLVLAGALFRVNTYLVAFRPGAHWSYFPAIPELAITIGIFSLEVAIYIWAVRRFPILAGPAPAAAQ